LAGKSSLPIRLDRYKSAKQHDENAVLTESFWDNLVITKWTLEAEQQQWLKAVPTANLTALRAGLTSLTSGTVNFYRAHDFLKSKSNRQIQIP